MRTSRPRHGERDAGDARAGPEVEPAGPSLASSAGTSSSASESASRRSTASVARAHGGDVAAAPAQQQVEVARERVCLGLIEAEVRREVVERRHGGESSRGRDAFDRARQLRRRGAW